MTERDKVLATIATMTRAFHDGDIDGILRTYEGGAVVYGEPGKAFTGSDELKSMFAGFIAVKARFTFSGHEVSIGGDLAVHVAPWTMAGEAPDGSAVTGSGLSVAVLRRQADGRWLMVIDNPFGDVMPVQATR